MFTDWIYIPLIIVLGLVFIKGWTRTIASKHVSPLYYLFFFHLVIGVYYCFFIYGDANRYWNVSHTYDYATFKAGILDGEGTVFMEAFNAVFSSFLQMSYLSNTLFYSLLGFVGLTLFYKIALDTVPLNKRIGSYVIFPALFFLPNLHFWSVAIGKDTLLFLCIAMFTYGIMKPGKRIIMIILGLLLAMAIRPHIVLFLVAGFGLAYLFGGKIPVWQRTVFSVLMIGVSLAILPSVMEFAKIEEASVESFDKFSEGKAAVLSRASTGSAIDISSYPFPLKVLTFWFRPFFFDVRNVNGLMASAENLILVIVFFKAMRLKPLRAFRKAPFVIKGLVFFLILGTLAFSQSLGNVGIMIRMRNMFLPGMLIYLLWVFSYDQQRRLEQQRALKRKP